MTVSVLWLFLAMPWVGMQCVVPDHTHLHFNAILKSIISLLYRHSKLNGKHGPRPGPEIIKYFSYSTQITITHKTKVEKNLH